MACKHMPDFQIQLETAEENIQKLIKTLKPNWNKEKIQIQPLSGGRSNLMSRCFVDPESDDQVVTRASQVLADNPLTSFPFETKVVLKMSELGHFGKVLATFKNGYSYELVKGKPIFQLTSPSINLNDLQVRTIAEKLADINCVKLEDENYTKTQFFDNLHKMVDKDYPALKKFPPKEELKEDLTFWENKYTEIDCDKPLVTCHGDSHPGNIIWNEENNSITFVDWEISHIGHQAFDVGYILHVLSYEDISFKFTKVYPDDIEKKFIQCYLEKYFNNTGRNLNELTQEYIQQFTQQVEVFKMIAALYLPLIMTCMMKNQEGIDDGFQEEFGDPTLFVVRMFDFYKEKKKAHK